MPSIRQRFPLIPLFRFPEPLLYKSIITSNFKPDPTGTAHHNRHSGIQQQPISTTAKYLTPPPIDIEGRMPLRFADTPFYFAIRVQCEHLDVPNRRPFVKSAG